MLLEPTSRSSIQKDFLIKSAMLRCSIPIPKAICNKILVARNRADDIPYAVVVNLHSSILTSFESHHIFLLKS